MSTVYVKELAGHVTVDEASKRLGLTFPRLDYLIRKSDVEVILIGHTRLIHRDNLNTLRTYIEAKENPQLV